MKNNSRALEVLNLIVQPVGTVIGNDAPKWVVNEGSGPLGLAFLQYYNMTVLKYYHVMLFFALLIRATIKAVTVICCRQAGRRAGPDWTGTLLVYG